MSEAFGSNDSDRSAVLGRWLRILLLPAALLATVYIGAGFYYDTNDDVTLMLLVRGITAARPVADLHIYHAGWAKVLAALYTWQPAFPWYDALLTGLMYAALATAFYVLETVVRPLRYAWNVLAAELFFFAGSFVQSLLQFNFTRPAILLGATAGLLLVLPVAPTRRVMVGRWLTAAALFVAGWGLRSTGADLGAALVLPLLLLQPRRYMVGALLFLGLLGGSLTLGRRLLTTPAGQTYLRINEEATKVFDYHIYTVNIQNSTDSLALATLELGAGPYDAQLVNEKFFQRVMRPAPAQPLAVMAQSLVQVVIDLVRQWRYSALVWTLVAGGLVVWAIRRGTVRWPDKSLWLFVGYQLYFFTLYVAVPLHFHFALRVVEPMMTVYLLSTTTLLAAFQPLPLLTQPLPRRVALGLAVVALLTVGLDARRCARLLHGVRGLERDHAAYLAELQREAAGTTVVEMGLYDVLDNLRLFKSYGLSNYNHILTLAGSSIYDPSQPALRRLLTGRAATAPALQVLGHQLRITWLLQPRYVKLLEIYLNTVLHPSSGQRVQFVPAANQLPVGSGPRRYIFQQTAP